MIDEPEEKELEEGEPANGCMDMADGQFLILDMAAFVEKTKALAVHITVDELVFVLNSETLCWTSFPVAGSQATGPRKIK